MYFSVVLLGTLVLFIQGYYDDDTYRAAVVSLANRTTVNVFEEYITEAKKHESDIVVFPELSILMLPEKIVLGETPHDNPEYYATKPIQYRLSGAAKEHQIYIALSIFEHGENCNISAKTHCLFGWFMYNTEIVFDRTGKIVLAYRKAHNFLPYLEDVIHHGPGTPTYFDADFGVRFGTWICFDIFFEQPQTDLLNKYGIKHFVYSEDWYDDIPITALTFVQGWSRHFGVTILAANNQVAKLGYESTGSGIIVKGDALSWTISTDTQLLIADVPKKNDDDDDDETAENEQEDIYIPTPINEMPIKDHFKAQNNSFIFLATPGYEESKHVLDIDVLKCTFSFKVTDVSNDEPQYYMVIATAFEFGVLDFEACFIQNCGTKKEDCVIGDIKANIQTTTDFDSLEVISEYHYNDENLYVLPVVGGNDKSLMVLGQFNNKEEGNVYTLTSTHELHEPILFAGHTSILKKPNEKYRKN